MIKRITLVFFISIISCKTIDSVVLIKNTGLVETPYALMYEDFPFNTDTKGRLDSIKIKGKEKIKIFKIFKNFKKQKGMKKDINFLPDYAFILKYNNIKDTLFFDYDFEYGYFVQNDTMLIDTAKVLEKFLLKKYKKFLEKDFYYYEKKYHPNPYNETPD